MDTKENKFSKKKLLKERFHHDIERWKGFARLYRKNKTGMAGLILLSFFIFIAIFAPVLATNDPGRYNRLAPPFSAPMWTKPLDPLAFDNIESALPNPSFRTGAAHWEFSAEGQNANWFSGGWVNDTEHPGMINEGLSRSDTGAYYLLYNDSDPNVRGNYFDAAWLSTAITWNTTKRPAQVYIWVSLRTEITGDFDITDFDLEFYTRGPFSDNTSIYDFSTPFYSNAYHERRLSMNYHHILSGFDVTEEDNIVHFMFRLGNIRNNIENNTGSIKVFIDEVRMEIRDKYWGLMGSTDTGADVYSQLLYGTRASLIIGITATAIAVSLGVVVGMIAGYFGGKIDELLMRIVDFLLVIPRLPMLMVLAMVMGSSITNIILILGLLGWDGTARLIRSQVLSERNKAYVDSARAVGASDTYIIFRHILPNVTPLLFVQITLGVVGAILSEAGLSFLGLGDPASASWGIMLQNAFYGGALLNKAWWFVIPPGLGILFLSLAFTFVGYALDTVLNPKLRTR
ncbi:MAG: ABC transporter permease [Candidatus Ranarchaeia archaeon]